MRALLKSCAMTVMAVAALAACGRLIPTPPTPGGPGPARPTRPQPAPVVDPGLVDAPLDGSTRGRMARAAASFAGCHATLDAAGVRMTPVPDRADSAVCGWTGAGTLDIDRGTVARLNPAAPIMTCQAALAFSIWRRQSIEPAAREILGSDVVQIDHFGTYACRPVNNQAGARPSAHSRAEAVDVAGVRLRDGRRITVAAHWAGDGPEARFLRRIRDDACRLFGTTLSPDYNAFHADHLHMETDGRFCR